MSLVLVLSSVYAAATVLWQVLRLVAGDRWWWLALANTGSLYLLLPSLVLWPLAWLTRRWPVVATATVPLAALLALYGGLFLPKSTPLSAENGSRLSVLTLNVQGSTVEADPVEAIIRVTLPDVICFQEFNPRVAAELADRLANEYPYRALPAEGMRWLGVFSRFPLEDEGEISDPAPRAGARVVRLNFQGQSVLLFNAHATQFGLRLSVSDRDPEAIQNALRLREAQIRVWLDRMARHEGPIVLAGDLNLTDQNTAYRLLASRLQDAHREAGWGLGHSWPAFRGAFRGLPFPARLFRLDYVWASDDWRVLHAEVLGTSAGSDHLPVLAELMWRPETAP